jgi:hypothetical protein
VDDDGIAVFDHADGVPINPLYLPHHLHARQQIERDRLAFLLPLAQDVIPHIPLGHGLEQLLLELVGLLPKLVELGPAYPGSHRGFAGRGLSVTTQVIVHGRLPWS